jgi:hypothetical protein
MLSLVSPPSDSVAGNKEQGPYCPFFKTGAAR